MDCLEQENTKLKMPVMSPGMWEELCMAHAHQCRKNRIEISSIQESNGFHMRLRVISNSCSKVLGNKTH